MSTEELANDQEDIELFRRFVNSDMYYNKSFTKAEYKSIINKYINMSKICYNCTNISYIFYVSAKERLCKKCTDLLGRSYMPCHRYLDCLYCKNISNKLDLKERIMFLAEEEYSKKITCLYFIVNKEYQLIPPVYNGIKIINYDWYMHAFGGINASKFRGPTVKFIFDLNNTFDNWLFKQKTFYNNGWRFKIQRTSFYENIGINITYYIPLSKISKYLNIQDIADNIMMLLLIFHYIIPQYKIPQFIKMRIITTLTL